MSVGARSGARMPLEEAERVRREVLAEVDREERMLDAVREPLRGEGMGWLVSALIVAVAVIVILLYPVGLLLWVLVTFLLYSFNFIIWFLPTTRRRQKATADRTDLSLRTIKGPLRYIVRKKKGLGVEILLTMFLSGMVPLAASFFVLFGVGILFCLYFGFVVHVTDQERAMGLILQMAVILLFFVLLLALRPQERGLALTARRMRSHYERARVEGVLAWTVAVAVIALFVSLTGLLFIGAVLFPGGTWEGILAFLQIEQGSQVLVLAVVLSAELVLMRHFQALSGRKMARALLRDRITRIRQSALVPLTEAIDHARRSGEGYVEAAVIDGAERSFYSIVIYDLFEHNLFGRSPVFVVGPNVSVVLDENALAHVT